MYTSLYVGIFARPAAALLWPKTLYRATRESRTNHSIEKKLFVMCPSCKCLYTSSNVLRVCTSVSFGKRCGAPLGYIKNLAHGRRKWKPHKVSGTATQYSISSSKFYLVFYMPLHIFLRSSNLHHLQFG